MMADADDIDANLQRARKLATQRYVCPVCDGAGCGRCDNVGEVSKDLGQELLERVHGRDRGVLKLVGQGEVEHTVSAHPLAQWQTWNSLAVLLGTSRNAPPDDLLNGIFGAQLEARDLDTASGVEHREFGVPKGTKTVYRVANAEEYAAHLSATKPVATDWLPPAELARQRGLTSGSLYGGEWGGFRIEQRTATDEDRERLGIDGRTKRLMRAVSDTGESWATSTLAEPPAPAAAPESPAPPAAPESPGRTEVRLKPETVDVELRKVRKERNEFERDLKKAIGQRDELRAKVADLQAELAENDDVADLMLEGEKKIAELMAENAQLRAYLDEAKAHVDSLEQELVELEPRRPCGSDADDSKWLPVLWNIAAGETHPEDVFELLRQHHLGRLS